MIEKTNIERAHAVIQAAHLQDKYTLEPHESHHQSEVWSYGPYILRIHSNAHALAREANLLRALPTSIPHASVVASGEGWIVQGRSDGVPLSLVWPSLNENKRRAAAQQLAAILINLHQIRTSGIPSLSPGWYSALLPAEIFKRATEYRSQAPDLMDAVIDFTRSMLTETAPPLRWGFIHRDLHFGHVIWNGERITALLDFESAVLAPRELELEMLVRFCRYPTLCTTLGASDLELLLSWLQEDYPLLFGEPGLERRLKLYSIEHDLRLLPTDPAALGRLQVLLNE